ncbi:hypothetical protein CRG98_022373 [Punica granatum]|uniref:DUF7745 domain-containing protein n=1 Tax=Punica granatum TaxID=22663 RepID=A0A2I0JLS6_PUNGR|nr:hypothetical protein CRG98_022373 [Punica granatum]
MDRSAPSLRLEAITPPRQEIQRIWRTFRPVDHAFIQDIIGDVVMLTETLVDWIFLRTAAEFWDPQHVLFNFHGTELAPTIEEYTALLQRPTSTTQSIFVPNPFAIIQSQLSALLGIPVQEVYQELHQGWDHGIRIAWLSDWTLLRALTPSTASYQRDAYYVREVRRGRMRGSPHPLQVWLLAHIRPFCSSHPFSYIADERSLIERLVPVFPPPERSFSEWRHFWRELTPARFLWVARWNPGGPMITGCPGIVGAPLLSHLGSTLIFPGRVIKQLGSLQDIPTDADRLPYRIQWADSTRKLHPSGHARRATFHQGGAGRLRCVLVDSWAEVADYRELQTELARARARIATLDREMARLSATLDRVWARAREAPHP